MNKERLEEIYQERENCLKIIIELIKEDKEKLKQQNKRYREALEFYANEENYKPFDGIFLSSYQNLVDADSGEKARKALEGEE